MTVADLIEELSERLAIAVKDDELDDDMIEALQRMIADIDAEVKEKGYVDCSALTPEVMAMPADEFVAMCMRRCHSH